MQKTIRLNSIPINSLNGLEIGIYVLELFATSSFNITAKKFINTKFYPGYYYYVGSAQKGLSHRIERHLKRIKKIHWHIDYLTCKDFIDIKNVFILKNASKVFEIDLANKFSINLKLNDSIVGFGNSDTAETKTHLFYSPTQINYNHLLTLYQSMVRFIPSSNETF